MHCDVIIDGRPLVGARTGIGVHTAEIARRLDVEPRPLIATHAPIEDRTGIENLRFRVDHSPLGVLWQQTKLARIAEAGVLWGPHGTLPLALRTPSVVTLHDFTSITMAHRHRLKTLLSFNLVIGRSLELASRVAAVSRAVADEAIRGFGVAASKIELVPNGVDPFFSPGGEEQDYILFTGTLEPRKGIDDLLAAWESLPQPRPRLVLAGAQGWGKRFEARDGVEFAGFVTRERLRELYRGARVFVYPSRYEGFGIPPLEAIACGAPTIATATGAIPEYGRDVIDIYTPGDVTALRSALVRLLGSRELRTARREAGPARAAQYGWGASAATMTRLLTVAMDGGNH
jgi:glycosyltransferase involved in cell wall biosynthesis